MIEETVLFTSSVDLNSHPMINSKIKLKKQYYLVLEHFVQQQMNNKFIEARLEQYRIKLLNNPNSVEKDIEIEETIKNIINSNSRPWRKKYRYWIMCDIALILLDEELINNVAKEMKLYMTSKQQRQFDVLLEALKNDNIDISSIMFAEYLILQYRENIKFAKQPLQKFIVTANMSAGKSTLINALIGKTLARTSQEVCTSNICYLYNKAFEDEKTHLYNNVLNLNAKTDDLVNFSWKEKTSISSYFRGIYNIENRLCIIDTPGVNSAINQKHGRISREALKEETYEKVIYVLNANKLGTDEEIAHIKWISDNVPKDKVIFVLNKLDDFNIVDDNISASIEGVRNDLISMGFDNPIICPMSAYFAMLIKMKINGYEMTEDEEDEYSYYLKKFNKSAYDLSKYYNNVNEDANDSEIVAMSKKCGLYGLEKILFGGAI